MKSIVLNNNLTPTSLLDYADLNVDEQNIFSELFEQLLIFDKVRIATNRINSQLFVLIKYLGLDVVERLMISGYIEFTIWPAYIFTSLGTSREDGTVDESTIIGQKPLVGGSLSSDDMYPDKNIDNALNRFQISSQQKKDFKKKALKCYLRSDFDPLDLSSKSVELVIEAYKANNFVNLGLPFEQEPEYLSIDQRGLLLDVGNKLLETAVLARHNLKSYNNYEHYAICEQNLQNIGKAYNISDNTSKILDLEDLPNLKEIFINGKLDFESIFKIRHLSTAKYYREWINNVGENSNSNEVTREYVKEIKGNFKYFNTVSGKIFKNAGMFAAGIGLTAVLADPTAGLAGSYLLGLVDDLWLDNLLKGKSPSMFIEDLREKISQHNI